MHGDKPHEPLGRVVERYLRRLGPVLDHELKCRGGPEHDPVSVLLDRGDGVALTLGRAGTNPQDGASNPIEGEGTLPALVHVCEQQGLSHRRASLLAFEDMNC